MPIPITHDEANLIERAQQNDLDAFSTLYQRYIRAVYNRVRYVVPEEDVEDVTQEIFLAALRSIHNFRGEAQFSTWLRALTNRQVAEYYRKRQRRGWNKQTPIDEAEQLSNDLPQPNSAMEERIILRRALQALPENYRDIILLRFAEGLQFDQIATLNGQNLEATKSLFRRSMAALRKQLEPSHEPNA
jgi:RNA polymerase sigma-70 factor (ECF subfamily)